MKHKKFSEIYDEFMNQVDYYSWYKFIKSFLKNKKNLKIADLGCGTGNISSYFAKENHNIFAYDISDDMIEIANKKYAYDNLKFIKADILKDDIENNLDLVMCNFDTINYFSSLKEFEILVKKVNKSLKKDSIFIFDFVEEEIFDEMFENDLFIDQTENYLCIMKHTKKSKSRHIVEIEIFIKEDNDLYRKYTETHVKNIYITDKIFQTLNENGFEIYDNARNSKYGNSRLFIIAKKRDDM